MIIFGTRSSKIGAEEAKIKCNYCESLDTTWIVMQQKYFRLFWIPVFPLRRKAVSTCSHCKQTLELKEFNANEKKAYEKMKLNG